MLGPRGISAADRAVMEFRPPRIAQCLVAAAVLLHWTVPMRLDVFANSVVGTSLTCSGIADAAISCGAVSHHAAMSAAMSSTVTLLARVFYGCRQRCGDNRQENEH